MSFKKYPSYNDFDLNNLKEIQEKNKLIPSKLYKYTRVHNAKDLLYYNTLYLPEIHELNDPYEGELLYNNEILKNAYFKNKKEEFDKEIIGDINDFPKEQHKRIYELRERMLNKESDQYIESLKKFIHEGIYFICLSSSNKINSLWAHYANNHDGICIEYDIKNCNEPFFKNSCFKVEYVETSDDTSDIKDFINKNEIDFNLVLKPFLKKSIEWEYEKEWRIILEKENIKRELHFEPYKPYIKFLKPSKVYLGLNISRKNEETIKTICQIKKIPLSKATKTNESYDFKFEEIKL